MTGELTPEAPRVDVTFPQPAPTGDAVRSTLTGIAISGPTLVVAGGVVVAFIAYATLAHVARSPWVFGDELWYMDAASSVVRGDGLTVRDGSYGYGLLYPLTLASMLWPVRDKETAYELFKVANALFFALAGIPIYLLARRVLTDWWGAAAAAASLAIPSTLYVSAIMTESLAFLVSCWALLAIALAVERPSVSRQIVALALILVAYGARPQLIALYVVYLVAIAVCTVVWPAPSSEPRPWLQLWPTALSVAIGAVAVVVLPELRGSSPSESFGAYSVVWRSYAASDIARWTIYHLADLDLYLAILPVAVAPVAARILVSQVHAGSIRARAFLTVFLVTNTIFILEVAAFVSTEFGLNRLHDRYLFYLIPLWLIMFALWLQEGLPRPLALTTAGAAFALALPVITPSRLFATDWGQFFAVASPLWHHVSEHVYDIRHIDLRRVIALFSASAVAAVVLVPRRLKWTLPVVILVVFGLNGFFAWQWQVGVWGNRLFKRDAPRNWIDNAVGRDARVTELWVTAPHCDPTSAFYISEFFNWSIRRSVFVSETRDLLPADRVFVGKGGYLTFGSGEPFRADYVLTPPGVRLRGRRLVIGSEQRLVLWRVGVPVRTADASSDRQLRREAAAVSCELDR